MTKFVAENYQICLSLISSFWGSKWKTHIIFRPIIFFEKLWHQKLLNRFQKSGLTTQSSFEGGYSNNILQGGNCVFLLPRNQYEVYDHKIWGEKTSEDPFQVSNVKFYEESTCGQQVLTNVEKMTYF